MEGGVAARWVTVPAVSLDYGAIVATSNERVGVSRTHSIIERDRHSRSGHQKQWPCSPEERIKCTPDPSTKPIVQGSRSTNISMGIRSSRELR